MAKHLNQNDVDLIVGLIDAWQGKLEWKLVVSAYADHTGHQTTRQTLSGNLDISDAFKLKKKGKGKAKHKPNSLETAGQTIDRLYSENERLKLQIARYEEQFVRWLYNATKKSITVDDLNMTLPKIDRDRTDV